MQLVNIGFGNIVSANRIIAIVSPESAPIKRIVQEAKDKGTAVDATYGRRTRAVVIMDSGHIILSAVQTETVAQKVEIKEKGAKYIGTKIDDKLEDEKVQNLINNNIIDVESKKSNLYCLDNSNLEELGLSNIKVDSFYIVDYKQNEVIYVDGIQNSNGETVYKLSDMNKKEE